MCGSKPSRCLGKHVIRVLISIKCIAGLFADSLVLVYFSCNRYVTMYTCLHAERNHLLTSKTIKLSFCIVQCPQFPLLADGLYCGLQLSKSERVECYCAVFDIFVSFNPI